MRCDKCDTRSGPEGMDDWTFPLDPNRREGSYNHLHLCRHCSYPRLWERVTAKWAIFQHNGKWWVCDPHSTLAMSEHDTSTEAYKAFRSYMYHLENDPGW